MIHEPAGPPPARWRSVFKLGVPVALACALSAGAAGAEEACFSQATRDALSRCPAGTVKPALAKKVDIAIKGLPPPARPRSDAAAPRTPEGTLGKEPRDDRRIRLAARDYQLLVTEIQQIETLFQATPRNAKDRPGVLRRLADAYVELEAASFRKRTELGIQIDAAKKAAPEGATKLTAERDRTDKVLAAARQNAIRYYDKLQAEHPAHCTNTNAADPTKSTGCVDEVLYYLAYEHEQAGELDKARKVYLQLIQKAPASKLVAGAYLAFGELYFNEAQADTSKWALAAQAYSEVLKYPLPDNKFQGYAQYKLAYVHWSQSDFTKALAAFKKAIEIGQQHPTLPNAAALAQNARRDIVAVYALSGQPKKAHDFLRPLSGDSGAETKGTFGMLDGLGHAYLDSGHYKEGIEIYQDLLSRDQGPKACLYQARIAEAVSADKSGSKDDVVAALQKQVEAYKKQASKAPPADIAKECRDTTAELVAETAMAWHLEAVGSGGVRGTFDKKTMGLSAQLYDTVLSTFDKEKFSSLSFPRIVKEDWPTRAKLAYLRADLLYQQKDWAKCGPAFDAAVAEDPTGPDAASAAYAAVLCHHRVYQEQHKGGSDQVGTGRLPGAAQPPQTAQGAADKLAPKKLTEAQKQMIGAFDRYLCYVEEPKTTDKTAREEYVDIEFARARMYFEAQRWEEAAYAFRHIALTFAENDAALPAAQLYLESANILAGTLSPARPACFNDMAADVPKFVTSFCAEGKEKTNAAHCGVLARVDRDLERRVIDAQMESAKKLAASESMKAYEKAANAYLALWKKYGEAACKEKSPACERNEEVLFNAATAFQSARLLAKAISVRKILIDPQYNLHKTELARRAVYQIGANYQAIATYDDAATYYERFASENPAMAEAPQALQDAIVLRLGLGQEKQAIEDAELFSKTYGAKKPALAARVAFAIGAHYVEKGDWLNARKRLTDALPAIDKHAAFDVQVQAHALLGRAHDKLKSAAQAQAEYTIVKNAYSNPTAVMDKLKEAYPDDAERARNLGKALTAVGEAYYFFAEQKKRAVDKIKFPEYTGSGERADVERHIATKVAEWVKRKRSAIDVADREYKKIAALTPQPPPAWTVAAAARVGAMWSKFVAEFRAAPIPKEWKQNGPHPTIPNLTWEEIRGRYYEEIDRASEPQKLQAKSAYETCLNMSVIHQHFDEHSRSCEVWLSKNYGNKYHLVDELRGAPTKIAAGLGDHTRPVEVDGTFARPDTAPSASPAGK